jgi:hypothetical protein
MPDDIRQIPAAVIGAVTEGLPPQMPNAVEARSHEPSGDRTPAILAYMLTVGFFGLLLVLNFHAPPDANLAMMNIVLGSLGTAWLGAMAYYFGASAPSIIKGRSKEATETQVANTPHA